MVQAGGETETAGGPGPGGPGHRAHARPTQPPHPKLATPQHAATEHGQMDKPRGTVARAGRNLPCTSPRWLPTRAHRASPPPRAPLGSVGAGPLTCPSARQPLFRSGPRPRRRRCATASAPFVFTRLRCRVSRFGNWHPRWTQPL